MDVDELESNISDLRYYIYCCRENISEDEDNIERIDTAISEIEDIKEQLLDKVGAMINPSEYSSGVSSQDYNQNGRRWAGTTYYRFQQQVDGANENVYMQDNDYDGTMLTDYYTQYVNRINGIISSMNCRKHELENDIDEQESDRAEYKRRLIKAEDMLNEAE